MLFFCVSLTCLLRCSAQRNDHPVFGILAQQIFNGRPNQRSYIGTSYVKLLESAGARVVPVFLNQPLEEYKRVFNTINGIILPGGKSSFYSSKFQRASQIFYELAIEAKNRGDHFPIIGTCLGIEQLFFLTSTRMQLSSTKTRGVTLPLTFTNETKGSRMFRDFPAQVMEDMATLPLSEHSHLWGMALSVFNKNEELKKFYKVLTTNTDGKTEFVSTIEAYDYPIYGTQWHPEKNAYEWRKPYVLHSPEAVMVTFYMAKFYVSEARKSSHRFSSEKEERRELIYNYNPVHGSLTSPFEQLYIFPITGMKSPHLVKPK
ncbi:gamma-glutamyl hydrolase-like [Clinocottus analis]|uniref:gamma-glutamyl hydrolase-like n=1 Tax=Clinocottus analis TaxID=304258 RepID=UPI0035C037A6